MAVKTLHNDGLLWLALRVMPILILQINITGGPSRDKWQTVKHYIYFKIDLKMLLSVIASLVPRRYVLFYGLRGLCVGRVDQFDRFRCEAPGRIRFDFWSGLRFWSGLNKLDF